MNESQGVEFDLVCIVGVSPNLFEVPAHAGVSAEHLLERKNIQRDLLYVALTRAITELHVLGSVSLTDIVR
jgi:superfamily I DNA/RNA helicase